MHVCMYDVPKCQTPTNNNGRAAHSILTHACKIASSLFSSRRYSAILERWASWSQCRSIGRRQCRRIGRRQRCAISHATTRAHRRRVCTQRRGCQSRRRYSCTIHLLRRQRRGDSSSTVAPSTVTEAATTIRRQGAPFAAGPAQGLPGGPARPAQGLPGGPARPAVQCASPAVTRSSTRKARPAIRSSTGASSACPTVLIAAATTSLRPNGRRRSLALAATLRLGGPAPTRGAGTTFTMTREISGAHAASIPSPLATVVGARSRGTRGKADTRATRLSERYLLMLAASSARLQQVRPRIHALRYCIPLYAPVVVYFAICECRTWRHCHWA